MKLYIPCFNSRLFLENLDVDPRFDVVVVDNHSTDGSSRVAMEKGWTVVGRDRTYDRVDNWSFAVDHFLSSNGDWCKWLFTGDELYPDAYDVLDAAQRQYPEAKLIVAEYDIVHKSTSTRWKMFPETKLIYPKEAMKLAAEEGNWFGSPIGHVFKTDSLSLGYTFGDWTWVADMQFCLEIASKFPVLYLAKPVGKFHVSQRKTFSSQSLSLNSSIEEYSIRLQAAKKHLKLTGNSEEFASLQDVINKDVERDIIKKARSRKISNFKGKLNRVANFFGYDRIKKVVVG